MGTSPSPLPGTRSRWSLGWRCGLSRAGSASAAFFIGLASAAPGSGIGGAGPHVPTVVAERWGGVAAVELDGVVEPVRQATVAAQVAGTVRELLVRPGDRVRAGQALARLDDRDVVAAASAGDAGVARARADATQAAQALQRTRNLKDQGFISEAALDAASAQADGAQAALRQAQAARRQAEVAQSHALLVAPFDGVVLATHVDVGDLAAPGRPVATVFDPDRLRAVVFLPARLVPAARSNTRVEIRAADGRRWLPASRSVLPGTDPVAQTVDWRLDLPTDAAPAEPLPRPGQAVRVRMTFPDSGPGRPGAVAVPSSAVVQRGELRAVYVAQDGRFVLRAVRTGAASDGKVAVHAGLRAGERVATDGVRAGLAGARADEPPGDLAAPADGGVGTTR